MLNELRRTPQLTHTVTMALRTSQPHVASITSLKRASSPAAATPLRQSKRVKSSSNTPATSKTTPKKSQYFEQHSESSEPETDIENENSGYEDEDLSASAVSSPPESENQDEEETDDNSEGDGLRKRTAGIKGKNGKGASKVTKGQELWRPGVKTGLGPGQQVFIKLPKAREPGKIPYKDDTIHPNTMLFLSDLKENNDREWLKGRWSTLFTVRTTNMSRAANKGCLSVHDADYRQSKMDFDSFVESLTEKIVEKDETIPELPPKDLVRIDAHIILH